MKKIFITILFTTILYHLYCIDINETFWALNHEESGVDLYFDRNENFHFYDNDNYSFSIKGTYHQDENKVTLYIVDREGTPPEYLRKDIIVCRIENTLDSASSKYKLIFIGDGVELYSRKYEHRQENDVMVRINGITAIVCHGYAEIEENVRIRTDPGREYPYKTFYMYYWRDDNTVTKTYRESIPARWERGIEVLARRTTKAIIDGEENYWYFCRFIPTDGGGGTPAYITGWIWGGLLIIR